MHRLALTVPAALVIACLGCGGKRIPVPPRVDLAPRAPIGLVMFTIEGGQGSLRDLTTQRFMEHVLEAQPGTGILELGLHPRPVDAAEARRLGEDQNVRSVFVGHIDVSDVQPRVSIGRGLRASAEATVTISVRLLSTESGATVWTQSTRVRETIAALRVLDGGVLFGAENPDEAYGDLVNRMVFRLTSDFRITHR